MPARLFWGHPGLVLLLPLLLTAATCDDDDSSSTGASTGGGVASPLIWTNTSSVSGGSGGGNTPLLWIDPNLAPVSGGGSGGGDITFGDIDPVMFNPTTPQGQNPVCTFSPQNPTMQADETTLEGLVAAFFSTLIQAGGAGGFGGGIGGIGGIGGGGGINIVPPTFITPTLRPVIRASVKNLGSATPTPDPGNAWRLNACGVNFTPGSESDNTAQGSGLTASQAWTQLQNWAQNYVTTVTTQGWVSAGAWDNGSTVIQGLQFVQTPVGQTP